MRERHRPRVCRDCHAPMARQEHTCWRCGIQWAPSEQPRTTLRLVRGGALTDTDDAERWANEGGSSAPEVTPSLPATAART